MAASQGIGPIESLAPSPGPGRARILGAPQALRFGGDLVGALAESRINAIRMGRQKAAKDFNDQPADNIEGSAAGTKVTGVAGDAGDAATLF